MVVVEKFPSRHNKVKVEAADEKESSQFIKKKNYSLKCGEMLCLVKAAFVKGELYESERQRQDDSPASGAAYVNQCLSSPSLPALHLLLRLKQHMWHPINFSHMHTQEGKHSHG